MKLQLLYELSFHSVLWITSKSNKKYVGCCERSLQQIWENKNTAQRGIMPFRTEFFLETTSLNMLPESLICPGGSPNYQIRFRKHSMTGKECSENNPSSTYSQEPCVFSELKNITLHLCGFALIYAEIKSNSLGFQFIRFSFHFLQFSSFSSLSYIALICISLS